MDGEAASNTFSSKFHLSENNTRTGTQQRIRSRLGGASAGRALASVTPSLTGTARFKPPGSTSE